MEAQKMNDLQKLQQQSQLPNANTAAATTTSSSLSATTSASISVNSLQAQQDALKAQQEKLQIEAQKFNSFSMSSSTLPPNMSNSISSSLNCNQSSTPASLIHT